MNSATERARKIYNKLLIPKTSLDFSDPVDFIATEIEAAGREAVENFKKSHECDVMRADYIARGREEGFRAAQEKAVEIASAHECLVPIQECVCNGKIAERIKELKP